MPEQAATGIEVVPVLSYPRRAQAGQTYLMTVDLRPAGIWAPTLGEEVVFRCVLNAYPLFRCEPASDPSLVCHRFGGTYGPVRFLLTAVEGEHQGTIRLTLTNRWGMPLATYESDPIQVLASIEALPQPAEVRVIHRPSVRSTAPLVHEMPEVRNPFGEIHWEADMQVAEEAGNLMNYFTEVPFAREVVEDDVYLIIGRRGSGKTAMSQYLSFQREKPNPILVQLAGHELLNFLASLCNELPDLPFGAVEHLRIIWELLTWTAIHEAVNQEHSPAKTETLPRSKRTRPPGLDRVRAMAASLFDTPRDLNDRLLKIGDDPSIMAMKETAIAVAQTRPVIVVMDSLERYPIHNASAMTALSALVEHAAGFNQAFARQNIFLKVFLSGEVFPHLQHVLWNPLKTVRHPVFLLWRPSDLLRMICWRFHHTLQRIALQERIVPNVDWSDTQDVREKVWLPHFGGSVKSINGDEEDTFVFILRHTQSHPSELISICNSIAKRAVHEGTFPYFTEEQIVKGVTEAQLALSHSVVNSFSTVYPNAHHIVDALRGLPPVFKGSELDRRAKRTASAWYGNYSLDSFRRLVTELGVIGRVRKRTMNYVQVEFAYSRSDELFITHDDLCAVHPMFFRRLDISEDGTRVFPFSGAHAQSALNNLST